MPTRIEQLASNSTMYYRGDQCLEISPFDNYYMFTIYRESGDETADDSIPLNLTNLGGLYLTFGEGDGEIRIENYKNAEDVDMVNGQVVFRIPKTDAKKILALSSNVFYISSMITDGKTASDETVLYTGTWVDYATGMGVSLTSTITSLKNTIRELEAKLDNTLAESNLKIEELLNEIEALNRTIESQSLTIRELQETIDTYNSDVVEYITANILSTTNANSETNTQNKIKTPIANQAVKTEAQGRETSFSLESKASELAQNLLGNAKPNNTGIPVDLKSTVNQNKKRR